MWWFGYTHRRPLDAIVKKSDEINGNGNAKGKGRPKLTWDVVVRNDMNLLNLAFVSAEWQKRIHVADSN